MKKADFEKHNHETIKKVHDEKDARKAVKALLLAQSALLRASFEAEKAEFQAGYEAAIAGVDASEASADAAVDAVFANTGK